MRPRDNQKARVYAAERAANLGGVTFSAVEEAQEYVDRLKSSAWFQARWGRRTIRVKFVNGYGATGSSWSGRINMGVLSRNQWVMLHEIAHVVGPDDEGWHNAGFCAVFLALVRHELGEEAARRLRGEFVDRRVKHRRSGVIEPRRARVRTKSSVLAASRAERNRPATERERREAAETLRRVITNGDFGLSGTVHRTRALAVARALDI